MHILQINKLYFPWIGGIETAARDFAEHYNGTGDTTVTNLVCTPSGGRSVATINGVTTHRAATWRIKYGMPISIDFFRLFRRLVGAADLVLLHHPFPLAFVAYWLFGRSKRLVVWYHSEILRQKLLKLPFEPFLRFGLRRADCVLVSNQTIIRESPVLREYAAKCRVAYFGVDPARYTLTKEAQEQANTIRERTGAEPLILSIGRLVPYKGFRYLIDAMRTVPGKLLIVGSGPLELELRAQVVESGLSDKVQIVPSVPNLVPYYHACDVFVLPSIQNTEVFGIVQIEALACGKPVINTALRTGVPEVSVHGYSGYTVPPQDSPALSEALRAILSNRSEYARMSVNAREAVNLRFNTKTMFAAVQNAINPTFAAINEEKKAKATMKNFLSVLPRMMRFGLFSIALNVLPLLFSHPASAQMSCPDGSEPDALGCPTAPLKNPQQTAGSAPVSFGDQPNYGTPSADNTSETSAVDHPQPGKHSTETDESLSGKYRKQVPIPPEAPTEFQQFVEASTGKRLAIFGANLFASPHSSFSPVLDGPAPSETVIGPGDELRIRVWGQVNFSSNLLVNREGDIYLPKVGSVHVAGLPFSSITSHLTSVMNGVYHNYEMSVDLGEIHSIQIYMSGMARRPGAYTVSGLSTLVDAVFESGGPAAQGSMRHVLLKRDGKVLADYDLYRLIVNGDKSGDVQLQPGDVLYIPPAGLQVALFGSVRQPGIYELRGHQSIGEILETAGGKNTVATDARLSLDRIDQHSSRIEIQIAQDESGLGTLLADGDIVRVDSIASNFKQTVTLRGAVANAGRFTWHQGLHISDLIPDKDAVVKRDYWWYRTRLGLPTPELATLPEREQEDNKPAAVTTPASQTNWNYAVVERLDQKTMKTTLIPFSLGKLVLDHDESQDLELNPGDVITIFSQADIHIPIKEQTKYIRLEGEFVHPGIYSIEPTDTLRTIVERAGGFTPQAYLYGSVFTRISTRDLEQKRLDEFANQVEHQFERNSMVPGSPLAASSQQSSQDVLAANRELIAKLRNLRASGRIILDLRQLSATTYELPDMQLEDGDSLEVPFVPATVQVIGAAYNPHAFLYSPGLEAGKCLHMAGGPTRDADRRRTYVLRANGSVATGDSEPRLFAHGFEHLVLSPGDSIIVPEKNVKPSALAQLAGWTQLLSQASIVPAEASALK